MMTTFIAYKYPPFAFEIPSEIAGLRARAAECLATWGDFTSCAERVADLLAQSEFTETEFRDLARQIEHTGYRAATRAQKAKRELYRPSGDSHMSDADVVAAIRFLAGRDADHARDPNDEGWNSGHSSTGHWCYAMLAIDPAAAIAVGRTLVGKYQRQLAMAGIAA